MPWPDAEGLIDTACKSLNPSTLIMISEDSSIQVIKIGEWIDEYMKLCPNEIVLNPEQKNTEILKIDDKIECFIPTSDNSGNTSWKKVTHLIRHDTGDLLYEIKTRGGRKVSVVESESLLIFNEDTNTFEPMITSKIKIGNFVPMTMKLDIPPNIYDQVDMENYFSKTEYIYGTEYNKAHQLMNKAMEGRSKIPQGWWRETMEINLLCHTKIKICFNDQLIDQHSLMIIVYTHFMEHEILEYCFLINLI